MALICARSCISVLLKLLFSSLTFFTVCCNTDSHFNTRIMLNDGWVVWNQKQPSLKVIGSVPFTVHSRLFDTGVLQDPYYRFNDMKYRWVATDDWIFTMMFNGTTELLKYPRINLVFTSIDTIANVYLNGIKIGASRDKFLKYEFDVTQHVKFGMNKIELFMISPVSYSLAQSKLYIQKYKYPILPNCYPKVLHGECHSNFIRKEPCSFGWDFGPSFPTQGLFESVYIEGIQLFNLGRSMIKTKKEFNGWIVHVCSDIYSTVSNAVVLVDFEILDCYVNKARVKINVDDTSTVACTSIHINSDAPVKEWWPRQYGNQHMYTLQVTIYDAHGRKIQSGSTRFGFRTVELIQQPILASEGLSFYFRINDVDVFLKGSNWIPPDALRDRVTNATIDLYLQSAIDANINVLRVWGGGGFESDYFYETCDRLGLLIWQDFMFACAMYPTNPEFLELVGNETVYQLKRLYNHPSIIIWSANNENEIALRDNWYGTQNDFVRYKMDYVTLYVKYIREIVKTIDKTRPFIVSSPSNGAESRQEGWVAKDPGSSLYGDVHHYNYTANCWNAEVFPKPRFASEYGYQSYPSLESLKKVSLLTDLKWNSSLMYYRQHHQDGNKQIEELIKQNFKLPTSSNESIYFEHMVYMSQIMQSVCVAFETEHYRRLRGRLVKEKQDVSGSRNTVTDNFDQRFGGNSIAFEQDSHRMGAVKRKQDELKRFEEKVNDSFTREKELTNEMLFGHTMGAMYWQLNDIWQAPSWASIEYGGKWKMLHYYAKSFFRDVALSYESRGDMMDVFIVSDLLTKVYGSLTISAFKWSSLTPIKKESYQIMIPSQMATLVKTLTVLDWCQQPTQCFLVLSINVNKMPEYSYTRPMFLAPFSAVDSLKDPKVNMTNFIQVSSKVVRFTVVVQNPAAFLWLDTSIPGHFSDNGFVQFETSKTLFFYARDDVTIYDITQSLRQLSLYNTIDG